MSTVPSAASAPASKARAVGHDGAVTPPDRPPESPDTMRARINHWALGTVMAIGAVVLLLKPGGIITKAIALVLAGGAVAVFARRNRTDSTVIVVVLIAIAAFFAIALLTGNTHWVTDRYPSNR